MKNLAIEEEIIRPKIKSGKKEYFIIPKSQNAEDIIIINIDAKVIQPQISLRIQAMKREIDKETNNNLC